MNSVNLIYSSEEDFAGIIAAKGLQPDKEYLVRVHTTTHTAADIEPFIRMILRYLPGAKIIGSSTTCVIFEGHMRSDCCMISISDLSSASVRTCMVQLTDSEGRDVSGAYLAERALESIVSDDSRFMLAFFARPFLKINDFPKRLNEIPELQLIGGIANTAKNPTVSLERDAFVFDNSGVSNNAAAMAVIDAPKLHVNSSLIYATEPVGDVHTITSADGMIIRTIDGEDAVEWYQNQLGLSFSDDTEYDNTILFPVVRTDYGSVPWAISYSPQNEIKRIFPNEAKPVMFVPSEASDGEHIRISYTSIQKTIEVCEDVCHSICEHPAEVLFGYSCVSRMDLFKNCAKWELLPFADTDLCGAIVAGELGNTGGKNLYCNYSFAIAALAEGNIRVRLKTESLRRNSTELFNSREHIVDYLVGFNSRTNGGTVSRQQLDIQNTLFTDDVTGLQNTTKYSYDFTIGKFDKICMVTFRNELLIKTFMSSSKFNAAFRQFHDRIMGYINDESYDCYVYNDSSLIITASPYVCDGEFIDLMKSLQDNISDFKFGDYLPVCEFSVVMHEVDMIKKAELALENMRRKKHLFIQYTSDQGLEQTHAKRMNMLLVLNDAIANDRVVPFFQGIRDNSTGKIRMYESLMRLEDASGQIYTPYRFMDTAKEYGYYSDISYMMISKVMAMFRDREEAVTINLSISDVSNYKIVHHILKSLKNAPNPGNFIFELTETEEIENYQLITAFVDQVHQMGGKVAIDDFGSGFSNIVNILKVESDFIKIDGEIVRKITTDAYAYEFLEMFASWAKRHNKEIIAEFIENDDIQSHIDGLGIRYSQGYRFSTPDRVLCGEDGNAVQ